MRKARTTTGELAERDRRAIMNSNKQNGTQAAPPVAQLPTNREPYSAMDLLRVLGDPTGSVGGKALSEGVCTLSFARR